jgi:hypothetical protein
MFPSSPIATRHTAPQDRRRLQLKPDSSTLLSSPKHGLMGQFFNLKTKNSYSKCTQIPISPRQRKSEDELVVVRATPLKPSELFGLSIQKTAKATEARRLSFQNGSGDSLSQGDSMGSNNQQRLQPIQNSQHKRRKKKHVHTSPIDKSRYSKPRNISPLKRDIGLEELTIHEARHKYKQTYPTDHPPEILLIKHKKGDNKHKHS